MVNWTIQKLLNWVARYLTDKGVDSPRLSAELLLCQIVGLARIELYTQFDMPVPQRQLDQLHDLVRRAGLHEPAAYLTGRSEFYSIELDVTSDCLIPRPETELLVGVQLVHRDGVFVPGLRRQPHGPVRRLWSF